MTGLREGNEELAQAWAADFSTNYFSDSPDNYYKFTTDPDLESDAMDFIPAAIKGFSNTYGNADRWEEFAIGALTGLIGTPTFGRVANADANTWLGRGKLIGITGGLGGAIASARENNRRGQEVVDRMNAFKEKYGFDDTADDWIRTLITRTDDVKKNLMARKGFNDAKDGFSETDNKFEFKNAEDNDMWMGINAFISAGRKADLMDLVSPDFEHMSQEELENIAKLTSPQDLTGNTSGERNTTGWRDSSGNYLTDTEEGTEEMRKQLVKKRDAMKSDIDLYEKALNRVRAIANNDVNRNEDEVSELAWLLWKVNKFKERAKSISVDRNADFNLID